MTTDSPIGTPTHLAQQGNPSGAKSGLEYLTNKSVRWIVVPILCFHGAGFGMLMWLCVVFLGQGSDVSPYLWPAIIAAFAGLPYGFATNIKKLVDTFTRTG